MGRKSNAQIEAERLAALPGGEEAIIEGDGGAALAVTDTPEFKNAVAEAVANATASITQQILSKMVDARPTGQATTSQDHVFAEQMAMAIAALTDQGTGRGKRVSPEIVRQRAEARDRMMRLLVDVRANGTTPIYHLRNKVFFAEQLIEPVWVDKNGQHPTEIEWRGVPNDAMMPVNEPAKAIFAAYKDSVGSVEKNYEPPLLGVTYNGLVIRSGSKAVRPVAVVPGGPSGTNDANGDDDGLRIPHRTKGGQFVEKNILGTVAPAARQTA